MASAVVASGVCLLGSTNKTYHYEEEESVADMSLDRKDRHPFSGVYTGVDRTTDALHLTLAMALVLAL